MENIWQSDEGRRLKIHHLTQVLCVTSLQQLLRNKENMDLVQEMLTIWQERVIYIDSLWYKILVQKWSQNLSSSWLAEYSCTWSTDSQGHDYYLHLFFVFSSRPWRFVPTTWKLWKLYFFFEAVIRFIILAIFISVAVNSCQQCFLMFDLFVLNALIFCDIYDI